MSQHFLLSRAAKTLSLAQVFRMTDAEAETAFKALRWADTNGAPVCPYCGSLDAYEARRPNGALRFRCKGCKKDFTITSGTLFASHKLPLRGYLAAIAVFCNEVKGKTALALSRDLGLSYKSAFVLLHKLREAMAEEMKGRVVGGEGKTAEIDGGYFGGYVKPANLKEKRVDRRFAQNQNGKRKVVIIIRERNGTPRFMTILTGRNLPKIRQSRETEPSTINDKTVADFARVVERTGILKGDSPAR
jgi:transposase-like protein